MSANYNEYFGFTESPFRLMPDGGSFYSNASYRKTYERVIASICGRRGSILIVGRQGVGKTTLLMKLMRDLGGAVDLATFCHTTFEFDEFVDLLGEKLGLRIPPGDASGRMRALSDALVRHAETGRTAAVLIDEAHKLSDDVLAKLGELARNPIDGSAVLQVVLFAELEFPDRLDQPGLVALKGQLVLHCGLSRFSPYDVGPYVANRLRSAGSRNDDLFVPAALNRIARHTKGVPRVINAVCDRALDVTKKEGRRTVLARAVDAAVADPEIKGILAQAKRDKAAPKHWKDGPFVVIGPPDASDGVAASAADSAKPNPDDEVMAAVRAVVEGKAKHHGPEDANRGDDRTGKRAAAVDRTDRAGVMGKSAQSGTNIVPITPVDRDVPEEPEETAPRLVADRPALSVVPHASEKAAEGENTAASGPTGLPAAQGAGPRETANIEVPSRALPPLDSEDRRVFGGRFGAALGIAAAISVIFGATYLVAKPYWESRLADKVRAEIAESMAAVTEQRNGLRRQLASRNWEFDQLARRATKLENQVAALKDDVAVAGTAESGQRAQELNQQVSRLTANRDQLAAALDRASGERDSLISEVAIAETATEELRADYQEQIDSLTEKVTALETDLATANATGDRLEEELSASREGQESVLSDARSAYERARTDADELRGERDALSDERDALQTRVAELDQALEDATAARQGLATEAEARVQELETQIAALTEEAAGNAGRIADLEAEKEAREATDSEALSVAQSEVETLTAQLEEVSQERDGLVETMAGLETETAAAADALTRERDSLAAEVTTLTAEVETISVKLQDSENAATTEVSQLRETVGSLTDERDALSRQLADLTSESEATMQARLDALAKAEGDIEALKTEVEALEAERDKITEDLATAEAVRDEALSSVDALRAEDSTESEQLQNQLAELRDERERLTTTVDLQESRMDDLRVKVTALEIAGASAERESQNKIRSLETEITALEAQLEVLAPTGGAAASEISPSPEIAAAATAGSGDTSELPFGGDVTASADRDQPADVMAETVTRNATEPDADTDTEAQSPAEDETSPSLGAFGLNVANANETDDTESAADDVTSAADAAMNALLEAAANAERNATDRPTRDGGPQVTDIDDGDQAAEDDRGEAGGQQLVASGEALMEYARAGRRDAVLSVIDGGISANFRDQRGRTPLIYAAAQGHQGVVRALLERGAWIESQDSTRSTALIVAADSGHSDVVKALLNGGADTDASNEQGETALMLASWRGFTDIVQAMLANQAEANLKNVDGWSAIMYAAINGHTPVVRRLLAAGADINTVSRNGSTALAAAAWNGHSEIVEALLKWGADANVKDRTGGTALMHAAENNHPTVVQSLLRGGASVNAKTRDGWTALMKAAWNGNAPIVQELMSWGADTTVRSAGGDTALTVARRQGHGEVVALVEQATTQ